MSELELNMLRMKDAKAFFNLDAFTYFWQLALDAASSELFTFMMPDGLFQPCSVPMVSTIAVAHAQVAIH